MSKYLIYMVVIDHNKSEYNHSVYANYSKKTWEYWCRKNNVDLHVVTEHNPKYGFPIWNQLDVCDIGKEYEKIGVVDCDTMVKWDTPNIFESLEDGISGVKDQSNLKWIHDSIANYGDSFFQEYKMDIDNYINSGVVFLDKESLSVYKKLRDFYFKHQDKLDNWNMGGGKTQTLLNYHIQTDCMKMNLIPPIWNLVAIHRKNMFSHNWQLKKDMTPFYVKYANIWHFTGFAIEQREEIMKQTWENYQDKYYEGKYE